MYSQGGCACRTGDSGGGASSSPAVVLILYLLQDVMMSSLDLALLRFMLNTKVLQQSVSRS